MNSKKQWEMVVDVPGSNNLKTYRLKVPGGWIYKTLQFIDWGSLVDSSVFVPRPPGYKDSDDDPGWRDVKDAPRTGVRIIIWVDADGDHVYISRYNCVYREWEVEGNCVRCIHDEDIKGWMPLPVMYKEKGENNE